MTFDLLIHIVSWSVNMPLASFMERIMIIKVYIAPNAVPGALDKLNHLIMAFGGSDGKAPACNAGDLGSIPRSGRSPGEGNGDPLQSSCLENSMDGGAW